MDAEDWADVQLMGVYSGGAEQIVTDNMKQLRFRCRYDGDDGGLGWVDGSGYPVLQ